ncbi:MAG: hypothetical protein JWM35_1100, partial [Verrucomicrobia bacterium]|nr:hypothetical protein [Verrucomicrobiota bacterium]
GKVSIRREKEGSINLLAMLRSADSSAATTAASSPTTPARRPDIMIGEVAVKDLKAEVVDNAAPHPATLGFDAIQLSMKNVTLADGAVIPLDLSITWAPAGTVHLAGNVTLKPELSADLTADVADLEILPLSPYVEQFVNAQITQGAFTTSSAVHVALDSSGALAAALTGDISVKKFGIVDSMRHEDLAGFGELKLGGVKVATTPQLTVSLGEVSISAPYARVVMNEDKTINLLAIAKTAETSTPPAPNAASTPRPKIEIARVILSDGEFSFTDRSVQPNVRMTITQFGGTISGLSSENLARGDVDLKGTVDGAGPVAITGKLDPLGPSKFVDLKVDFKNVDLLPVSPYVGKFAGYELARGKLVVDTKVTLDGKKLDSTNVVTLHQFTFGAATNSPEATGLPVRLGVALLKDAEGKIVIDLPVQGSLDDPNFRIGKVVMRVIVNLLTKVATSPFSLLGSMFGGGGDELAFQEFAPGSSELQASEAAKLNTMVKALASRPALSLGIEGGYDAAADTYALKQQKLADLVRRQIWETHHAADPNIPAPADLVMMPAEQAAMVEKLFDEKFPPGTEFGAPPAPPAAVKAAPSAPKPGVFKRVINAITFRGKSNDAAIKPASAPVTTPAGDAPASPAGPSVEEMTGRLAEGMVVDDNDLRALAAARAQRVRDYFITNGKVAPDRLFLSQPGAAKQKNGPRVFLSLQ